MIAGISHAHAVNDCSGWMLQCIDENLQGLSSWLLEPEAAADGCWNQPGITVNDCSSWMLPMNRREPTRNQQLVAGAGSCSRWLLESATHML